MQKRFGTGTMLIPKPLDKAQAERLKKEGYRIEPGKGKKPPKVNNFEKHLVKL